MTERAHVSRVSEEASAVKPLQHFEYALMLAVSNLGSDAYPAEITRRLSGELGRHVALAQVFSALERLEDKGYVESRSVIPDRPHQGGRRRRVFTLVEPTGLRAIRATEAAFTRPASAQGKVPNGKKDGRFKQPAPA